MCRAWTRRDFVRSTAALLAFPGSGWAAAEAARKNIAVLDFELLDLTYAPDVAGEKRRTATLKPLLEEALGNLGWNVAPVTLDAQQDEERGVGYLYDHADAAASLARSAGADWIVIGRLHKASYLFVYLKAHVVDAASGQQIADLAVEIKGPQERLTRRGVDALAREISETIGRFASQ
jgi:hypothetical protein